jgi:L,D-peptidoglycan transpeptidase YkuD (ErfK/YbiS/YcfS/YnhG family)
MKSRKGIGIVADRGLARRASAGANIVVRARSASSTRGIVQFGAMTVPCALGRSGVKALKREGDGATPRGIFALLQVFYRPDVVRPTTRLPLKVIKRDDGWCDGPQDRNYNRQVKLPYRASAEHLWRADRLYDLVVMLDHNIRPRVRGGGSAIFMHVARPGYLPTEGCVALSVRDLRSLIARLRKRTRLVIRF